MSVASLSERELACFAAIAVKLELLPLKVAAKLGELIACGNVAAWKTTYSDLPYDEPIGAEEIENLALDYLAGRLDMTADHFGPLAYNMISNGGTAFAGLLECEQDADILDTIRKLEKQCYDWQDAQRSTRKRAEQDAASFDDCPPLPKITRAELEAKIGTIGDRVIIATFNVDQSDSQSDYHGGRQVRSVVIGFGKGKRESFKQLRAAAGAFKPTEFMGPGRDIFTVSAVWDHNKADDPDRSFIKFGAEWDSNQPNKGHRVVFHYYKDDYPGQPEGQYHGFGFNTRAEVDEFIENHEPPRGTAWDVGVTSYENRENWSMGGGNYLGSSRYGGWKVTSYGSDYLRAGESFEYYEPTSEATRAVEKAARKSRKPRRVKADQTIYWTGRGLLASDNATEEYHDWPREYRSEATVNAKIAELQKMGYRVHERRFSRANSRGIKLDPPTVPTAEECGFERPTEPEAVAVDLSEVDAPGLDVTAGAADRYGCGSHCPECNATL